MVGEVFAGIGALKAAFDMSKAIVDISDAAKRDRLSINLQKEILSALAAQSELAEEVSELKTKLASFETWDTEKERYELKAVAPTAVAYVLKKDAEGTEPPHWLCPNCYQNRKKSFFQYAGPAPNQPRKGAWNCSAC